MLLCPIYIVAISGEQGRKALMREIELGKLLGETPHPNIAQFIGCVTTEGNEFSYFVFFTLFISGPARGKMR